LRIKLLNVLGGTLFASALLLFIQSVVLSVGLQIQVAINRASQTVVGNTPSHLTQNKIKETSALSNDMLDLAKEMNLTQKLLLAQAVIGAGLICLRE
jgi:hypothetical protein